MKSKTLKVECLIVGKLYNRKSYEYLIFITYNSRMTIVYSSYINGILNVLVYVQIVDISWSNTLNYKEKIFFISFTQCKIDNFLTFTFSSRNLLNSNIIYVKLKNGLFVLSKTYNVNIYAKQFSRQYFSRNDRIWWPLFLANPTLSVKSKI